MTAIVTAACSLITLVCMALLLYMQKRYHRSVTKRFGTHLNMIMDAQKTAICASVEASKLLARIDALEKGMKYASEKECSEGLSKTLQNMQQNT